MSSTHRSTDGWEEQEDACSDVAYSEKECHSLHGRIQGPLPYTPYIAEEGGRHWTDKEVRALLCVWADRTIRDQLKCTLRNKSIFQEMAHQMQQNFGVVRNWKQCRTKYKNLKYEYKTARNVQATGSGVGPGKYMKFFDEVEGILTDRELDIGAWCNGDMEAGILGSPAGQTPQTIRASESEVIIEIDDDDSDDYENDVEMEQRLKGTDTYLSSNLAASGSGQFHVVTVSDTGRNWSDQEIRALIQVWSEEGMCKQLENSTRKRDIFVQISNRLMLQGVERDWKQCHTKYKNLKYLYRSLQKGKAEGTDPRRLMRFYDEVDALLTRTSTDSPCVMGYTEPYIEPDGLSRMTGDEGRSTAGVSPTKSLTTKSNPGIGEDGTQNPDTFFSTSLEVIQCLHDAESKPHVVMEQSLGQQPQRSVLRHAETTFSENRGIKRKAVHQDTTVRLAKRLVTSKEEQDDIPIIEMSSVRSFWASKPITDSKDHTFCKNAMAAAHELKLGQKLNEGKTKEIYSLVDQPGLVLVQSKNQITAGNAVRKDQMEGKAAIANKTTSCVFKLLQEAGIKTAFVEQHSDTAFIAVHCEMIPIEWVCRRVATGSFLKRNPGVKEGYRFSPLKLEMFFKDDADNDPQWSEEQLLVANFSLAGLAISQCEVDIMNRSTVAIFEILERAWATQNCTLVDMKIEFGVNVTTKEVVLADVVDNDSWRLWPAGDRCQQKDKQVYRDLKEVTPEAMQVVKRNFEWVSEKVKLLLENPALGRVVVLMGSTSDMVHCDKIRKACGSYGVPCVLRVTSAHKGPDETLRIKAEYEGDGVPTVFVAVAGRSNGLGPVISGNTAYPVINCPPITADWGAQDVWSSLRMPSGLGCSTVLSPDAAAQFAAQIFGLGNHLVWSKLRASMLNTWVSLKIADKKLQSCSL
ncbi:multifunctional protein ADE2 isoform X1 [Gadus macrocephalus]|uniref:multifunctional protein ADE2 isoform X1 n=1 Tax=Gadus macrocephalus TaxID=80720 RepID=UPI0028CB6C53|nr:multifunctional protein ADE2 isoform X1 [Gadus macrocephalus]